MTAVLERRSSSAAIWSRRFGIFAAVLFTLSAAGHRTEMLETLPFLWLLAIVFGLALLALGLALAGLKRIWDTGERGASAAVWGLIIAACVLAPFAISAVRIVLYPNINDISTDLADPPELTVASSRAGPGINPVEPISEEAARLQSESYPDVAGRRYEYTRDRIIEVVDNLVAARGWRVLRRSGGITPDTPVTIEVEAKSFLLGFPADVAIRISEDENAAHVDMRSASRYGTHDFGDNAKRIRRFLADLDAQVAALVSR
ncbi:DUF1499 domain-containing protein [Mesorhizobium sp. J18]|uniref:DUF1499 domain-containing protein n=1 Tax=Mesorhizobium sp. J18 TaxID=935263 RepID=UPI0016445739|nr:DUF1499 domain-containing protein [Mesorhizobium sp. J18]